jgi:macrolide transport system ATP-binding/permease protein
MSLIELKGISKTYYIGGKVPVPALKNVSLKIETGDFVAIMGPSGSGKSTLLAILGLLDKTDSGEYKLLGKDITRLTANEYARLRNHFFGFVFQMFNLLPRLTLKENAMLPFIYSGTASQQDRERVLNILRKIGIEKRLRHRPNEISGGEQQRAAIARAVANQPLVILADEPTGNLDSKSAAEIINLLDELNAQGNTIIMVTHEPDLAEAASRTITLRDGQIVSDERRNPLKEIEAPQFSLGKRKGRWLLSFAGLRNYCREAVSSLWASKLRSFLSILGVLIGVSAVIAMLALGTGAQRQVEETLSRLGTNLLQVRSSRRAGGIALGSDTVTRFTFADLEAIKRIESVEWVVPYVSGRAQIVFKNRNWNTSVMGANVDFQYVRDAVPDSGRFFTKMEETTRAKVAVLGKTVVNELFGEEDPVGKQIRINRVSFNVIGVMPEKGVSGWRNLDDQIVVPVRTAMYRLLGVDYISYFDVQVRDAESMTAVQNEIVSTLMRLHRIAESETERIEVRNMAEIQEAAGEMVQTFAYLLGAIAAVSLLVGGIGIMNIMLVMVMERTHEIGLRKALGAENRDIMIQFLVEAVLICVVGGAMGIAFGSLVSLGITYFAGWTIFISPISIILAFSFSVLVGIIFGLWPAWRAAKLQPIVALRYE